MKHRLYFLILCISISTICFSQTPQQADSLHLWGKTLLENGNVIEGREYTRQALEMRKMLFGEVNESYINSLNNYAISFTFGSDINIENAIELQQKVMRLCGELNSPHPDFGRYALNMGRMYYNNGDETNAAKYWEQALPAVEKYSDMYENLLELLGIVYSDKNDIPNMERIMVLMEEHNQHELQKPCKDVKCMLERGLYYGEIGDNTMAKEWFLQALKTASDEEKIRVDEVYGTFLAMNLKEYASGAEYTLSAANKINELYGKNDDYAKLMFKTGVYYFLGRHYQHAIDCYQYSINFYVQFDNLSAHENIAICQKNMGNAYNGLRNYEKAKECFQKSIDYYEAYDRKNDEYPRSILHLAKAEKFNKDYVLSIEHHKQAMKIFEERNMLEDYSDAASSLQLCYAYADIKENVDSKSDAIKAINYKNLDKIIKQEKNDLQMTKTYLGKLMYARSLGTIAGCYYLKEDYDNSIYYYKQHMVAIREALKSEFSMQNEFERATTWNDEKDNIQDMKEILVTLPVGKELLMDTITAIVYDAALLSKGILLNSSIEFDKMIAQNANENIKAIYKQLKSNNVEIERLRHTAQNKNELNKILQLSEQNHVLQMQLYKGCPEIADFTDYLSYNWKDVQKALSENDIAIEFLAIDFGPLDENNYMAALVLTKDMKTPLAVPICSLEEVKVMNSYEKLYDLESNLVWGQIGKLLNGKKRVFFSADSGFNHIAIENLKYDGKPFSEQYQVYRLSSTKELCYHHNTIQIENVTLFGDINYNEKAIVISTNNSVTDINNQLLFDNLDNTKREISEIQSILKQNNINNTNKLIDIYASQSAFLNLNDTPVNLIHIATHGMYNATYRSTDKESMQNSLLVFAGANLFPDTHDGIVSAEDIAKMNLHQCDMVVLSACDTGLGKLGDDGVFGLQRGFKNAGARSILMSLWEVDDNATCLLMTEFYKHWIGNDMSKHDALEEAKKTVRSHIEKGWDNPKYWAAFILLDAIL